MHLMRKNTITTNNKNNKKISSIKTFFLITFPSPNTVTIESQIIFVNIRRKIFLDFLKKLD